VLEAFIEDGFKQSGLARDQIDSGAVILTGMALKRSTPSPSPISSPRIPASSSAPRPGIIWNASWPPTAPARSACRAPARKS